MPDTMLHTDTSPALTPASCGVMDRYRSPSIGKLVAARAKASAKIKAIVKDKQAKVESRKEGGRSYSYQYADLADVLDAIEEAISEQGMAIFQVTQDRGRDGTYLVTTLSHDSDQWIAGEIRLRNTEGGPQVLGSELTYLRRYAVLSILALAPEGDDDGATAQGRADQQARQPRQIRQEPQERRQPTQPPTPPAPPAQAAPEASDEPTHMPLPMGKDGPLVNRWTKSVLDILDGKSIEWRYAWVALHSDELSEVHALRPDNWSRINAAVGSDEMAEAAE
jgi:hypothetical protein